MPRSSWLLALLTVVLLAAVDGARRRPGRPRRTADPRRRARWRSTGPLAATALVHKDRGRDLRRRAEPEERAARPPRRVGPARRPVKPDLARTLYERLITVDKVDLLIGPYATGSILSAMGVAQRYDKLLVHHTFGIPHLAKYERQFPAWALGPEPGRTFPNLLFDALAASPEAAPDRRDRDRQVPVGALRVDGRPRDRPEARSARGAVPRVRVRHPGLRAHRGPHQGRQPDFLWVGAIGLDGNQILDALKKIDYTPRSHFYLYPAPGPARQGARGQGRPVDHDLRGASAVHERPRGQRSSSSSSASGRPRPGCRYTAVDVQAAASYTAWQLLEAAVTATKGPRRQGAGAVAQDEPGRHHHRQATLRRAQQLRRRPVEGEAGAGREVAGGVAEGVRGARSPARRAVTGRCPRARSSSA